MKLHRAVIGDFMRRAPTKTIAFTGAAGLGAVASPIPIWTITGRVLLIYGTAFCTETVVSTLNTGTIALGVAGDNAFFIAATTMGAGSLAADDWWDFAATPVGASFEFVGSKSAVTAVALSQNVIVTVATNPITDGTLVFDCFYIPLTDGAGLA